MLDYYSCEAYTKANVGEKPAVPVRLILFIHAVQDGSQIICSLICGTSCLQKNQNAIEKRSGSHAASAPFSIFHDLGFPSRNPLPEDPEDRLC